MTPPDRPPLERILLVDDDEVTNLMHTRVIQRSGRAKAVSVAYDGEQALEMLQDDIDTGRKLPELVFLDINMPRMGGFEFLEAYARLHIGADAPLIIVMLSTSLLKADHARAEADPNVHCFSDKPLKLEVLLELVDEIQRAQAQSSAA
ncbi:response regulator [Sulfitobacter albidus]|uniref:Response regulator n=1 Tax=Sulfitobacter albidus TaxID=2829501 RepID=A0A975JFT9_9RHOB|nr:response regulator [Sulfitobacter albidus]QUJ77205.1 response regulator [Sulfitobacter albidus]